MKYGLLGEKLGHSKSKIIHELLYKEFNTDDTYELIEVEKNELESMIQKLRDKEYDGFNVTIPYKEEVIKYLDLLSEEAKKIKAVNTIALIDGKVVGFNTDYFGFRETLKGFDIKGKTCYIMGSGGAALACFNVLNDLGAIVKVIARNKEKAKEKFLDVISFNDLDIDGYMIINATNNGMYPNVMDCELLSNEIINRFEVAYDLIYNPKVTKFLNDFSKDRKINGEDMLIYQAIYAFYIWKRIDDYKGIEGIKNLIKKEVF